MNPRLRLLSLAALCAVMAAIALPRLQLGYNLSAFLPPAQTQAQAILTQRLGQGPGAQLLFVELQHSSSVAAAEVAERLRATPGVERVLPESFTLQVDSLPKPIWQHRLLLVDLPTAIAAWQEVFATRLDDLAFAADDEGLALIAADPILASVNALQRYAQTTRAPAFDQGGRQYLIVQTQATAFDLAGQTATVRAVRSTLKDTPHSQLFGSPVYAVDLQSAVRFEATAFSLLASLLLLGAMIFRFRAAASRMISSSRLPATYSMAK